MSFLLLYIDISCMIDKQLISDAVTRAIAETDIFVVDIRVSVANDIVVEIDSPSPLDLDTCADISRKIEDSLDRDAEDFSLEVGTAGLTAPFKVRGQWLKNIGNDIELITRDGKKMHGRLLEVTDDDTITVGVDVKERPEGKKRPVIVNRPVNMKIADVKTACYMISFK